nr:type III secretion outer membrane protein PscC precursor [Pseudomonas plecoglossicida NB2011]
MVGGLSYLLGAVMIALALSPAAHARELDWPQIPYSYEARGETLRDVLVNFAANYNGSLIVSEKVSDRVNASFDLQNPQSFLTLLSGLYGLNWYYDGAVLYVFKATEMQSRLVRLTQVGPPALRQALEEAGIWEARFGWRPSAEGKIVYVSGPPRYLDLVDQVAQALEQQNVLRTEGVGELSVEIFPLKYAVAEDRQIKYRDDTVDAPGVATILSRVLGDANVVSVEGEARADNIQRLGAGAVVQADPSLNAIIVRDSKERMPMYRRLIMALDRPSARIEVGLSIVDINAENLSELGVDWRVAVGGGGNKLIEIRTTGAGAEKGAIGSLVDDEGRSSLMAKVTLLQSQGRAQIGSRPTLLTQENTLAVIDHSETFYVKVAGERVAELRAITYGTMLKMTPRVTQLGERPEISLSLHIEDGAQKLNSSGPDGLPTIARTVIDTVARVGLGQSLLIGGIHRDEQSEYVRKVPWLGDIPYLGALFRFKSGMSRRSVRLFLIEPRLIDTGTSFGTGAAAGASPAPWPTEQTHGYSSGQVLQPVVQCPPVGSKSSLQRGRSGADSGFADRACLLAAEGGGHGKGCNAPLARCAMG